MDEEEDFNYIGSMFDSAHERVSRSVHISRPEGKNINFKLRCIDEEPGHVQSGQYMWPAAEALATYLCNNWEHYESAVVVELGAGCGLAGISIALNSVDVHRVIFTDHDPGAVNLLVENMTLNDIADRSSVLQLEWGVPLPPEMIALIAPKDKDDTPISPLIIGSDLLYCAGVVRPLLFTMVEIVKCSNAGSAEFVLVSSFETGEDVEKELELVSQEFQIMVTEIRGLDLSVSTCRIQLFRCEVNQKRSLFNIPKGIDMEVFGARYTHHAFFSNRDWDLITTFWTAIVDIMTVHDLPVEIRGDPLAGITDLEAIHVMGKAEYISENPRYKRKTFAARIGYDGKCYQGFQDQKGAIETVEGELKKAIGRGFQSAGRTDKNVSAISQVISFHTHNQAVTEETLIAEFNSSAACLNGSIKMYHCKQVPREFHALFSATWRRYIYAFPLNVKDKNTVSSTDISGDSRRAHDGWYAIELNGKAYQVDVNYEAVNKLLHALEGLELPYNAYAFRAKKDVGEGSRDLCTLYKACAHVLDTSPWVRGCADTSTPSLILAIELVGNRFLRKMVRILSATAIRESLLVDVGPAKDCCDHVGASDFKDNGNLYDALVRIARSGNRLLTASALPGDGLCMCGVGYELKNIFNPEKESNMSKNKRNRKRRYDGDEAATTVIGADSFVALVSEPLNVGPCSTTPSLEPPEHHCSASGFFETSGVDAIIISEQETESYSVVATTVYMLGASSAR